MAAAILDLMKLWFKKEKLTPQEDNALLICASKAIGEFTSGFLIGSGVVFAGLLATISKLNVHDRTRFFLAPGAGTLFGFWRAKRSMVPWVDRILDMDGSPMQTDLANIIVSKHKNDPWLMQRVSRHFYSEKVYDDTITTSDKPMVRMCYRNHFGENVAHSDQEKHDNDSLEISHNESDGKKTHIESNKVSPDTGADLMEDPLDSIFGWSDQPFGSAPAPAPIARAHNHSHRRSHRRRRRMHHGSLGMKHA